MGVYSSFYFSAECPWVALGFLKPGNLRALVAQMCSHLRRLRFRGKSSWVLASNTVLKGVSCTDV